MAGQDQDNAAKCPVDHSTFTHFLPKDSPSASALPEGHPTVPTSSDGEPAKCPVSPEAHKHFMPRSTQSTAPTGLPEGHPTVPMTTSDGEPTKCPVSPEAHKHFLPRSSQSSQAGEEDKSLKIDPTNNMPSKPDQFRIASQRRDLDTEREISSIPKAANSPDPYGDSKKKAAGEGSSGSGSGAHAPDPDSDQGEVWIYPSEQMFFNAMKRKNWSPREEDMKFVVPIHNMVNEMAWKHILRWEKQMENTCGGPKLVKFEGKPKEITPKARIRSWMGYTLPFDRHDWVVDRCGKQVTYIIDFYSGQPDPRYPEAPSFYLDVRPKLTAEGAWQRFKKFMFD
ncbi:Cytochrome c1 heme lyase [Mortierella hygrophila]|uniref:Holocytochrome c-type synthase n=1 Tax=Mortierella hygrophila TaxID=979708 RepID=A0A9P6F4W8_9FUNG|nr:Cytochrome c1 heme lyase [Mortierella hygrophila]